MSNEPICMVCEDPVNIWKNENVTDAYQKDGINHYQYTCPECGVTNTHDVVCEDAPAVMTFESLKFSFKALLFG